MSELIDPEEGSESHKFNGHKPSQNVAPATTGSKLTPVKPDQSPIRQHLEQTLPSREDVQDEDDQSIIREALEDSAGSRPKNPRADRWAEKAADLVVRFGRQASTDSILKEYATRFSNDLNANQPGFEDDHSHGQMASAAYLEDSALIRAILKGACHAANEQQAGIQAALSVPLMIQQYRQVYRGLWSAIPALSAGTDVLARFLYRTPATRSLIMDLPKLLRLTLDQLSRFVFRRRVITSEVASAVFAEQTHFWLTSQMRSNRTPGNQEEW